MSSNDLKTLLSELKKTKPNEDWAISARADLINHIDASIATSDKRQATSLERGSWFERTLAQPKWAGAFTLGIFALMLLTASMAQHSIPGSPLYGVKIASEDLRSAITFGELEDVVLQAKYAERRVDEVGRIASSKLEISAAASVSETLESYKHDIAVAKESGNKETIEKSVAEANQKVEAWTSIVNEENPIEILEQKVTVLLASCSDDKLAAESEELLAEGGLRNMIDAFILLNRCDEVTPEDPAEDGAETEGEELEEPVVETE